MPEDYTKSAYSELCSSYRAIDDFRSKLLAGLPFVSGTGISLLASKSNSLPDENLFLPIGIFGFFITLGLFIFEIYGIRRCSHLIALGIHLEEQMKVQGQFRNRPKGLQSLILPATAGLSRLINEPMASGIIYPAVMGAWVLLALNKVCLLLAVMMGGGVFILGFVVMWKFNEWLVDTDVGERLTLLNEVPQTGDENRQNPE